MPGFTSAAAAKLKAEREEARLKAERDGVSKAPPAKPAPGKRRVSESPGTNRKPLGTLPTVHAASSGDVMARKTVPATGAGQRQSPAPQPTPTTSHLQQQVNNLTGNSSNLLLPCISCHNKISPSARFCSACGVKQNRSEEAQQQQQPQSVTTTTVVTQQPGSGRAPPVARSQPPPQPQQQPPMKVVIKADDPLAPPLHPGRTSSTSDDQKPPSRSGSRSGSRSRNSGGQSTSNVASGRLRGADGQTVTPPPASGAAPVVTASRASGAKSAGPAGGKGGGSDRNSAADNFPKMPLASEMNNKKDIFMDKIDTYAGKQFTAEDFEGAKNQKLSPLEGPGHLFAEADTRVFVRCRPILSHETDKTPVVTKAVGCKDVVMLVPQVSLAGGCTLTPYSLPVDAMFNSEDTNAEMYSYLSELVLLALRGGSSSILCYGQTGSGKTFTTTGLLQNMAAQIEEAIVAGKVEITATFVELHHEGCRDLISGEQSVNICEVGNKVELQKSQENPVTSAKHFHELVKTAIGNRSTKATLKNAGSSRSHMVIRILVKDIETPWANPGILCVADLAGSESNSDSKEHDKERVIETKFINSSLMTLKDCIRARGMAATSTKHVHIPYRQTSLTTIMKDSFELVVKRPTKAAVVACVSPLFMDIRHTGNTVRYASLLYVSPKKRVVLADNPEDPHCWDREETLRRLQAFGGASLTNPELILPEGDGRALVLIAEADFVKRVVDTHPKIGEKKAGLIYVKVWKAVVDSRTKTRKDVMKVNPNAVKEMALGRVQ